jgi:ureidoglycolate dehydrogenase (NAD+)
MDADLPGRTVPADRLTDFVNLALQAAGSASDQATAVAKALGAASLRGVDSHGVRLLPHYLRVLAGGRVARSPQLCVSRTTTGTAVVDADNGFGHFASYRAVAEGCDIAREAGVAAVSVVNSSHFAAAGCYALEAAKRGFVAFAFSNSDSFVLPHDGIEAFHGTNPIAFSAPVAGERPYLLDMATSILPWNRIRDYESKGLLVPKDVAVDALGRVATDPTQVVALLPLGGATYGFKGAALAGMIEILSAVLTGMSHCSRLLPMGGEDISTHRRLGHFFLVIDPTAFVPSPVFDIGMAAYLADLRASPSKSGKTMLAPGDREWACQDRRIVEGIPLSPVLLAEFQVIATDLGLDADLLKPRPDTNSGPLQARSAPQPLED